MTKKLLFTILFSINLFLFTVGEKKGRPGVDQDGDGVPDRVDVDDDNDGLIEIHTLNALDHIRYNLAGTSYKTSPSDPGTTRGRPAEGLRGYELTRNLDFAEPESYIGNKMEMSWRPEGGDAETAVNAGWKPLAHGTTNMREGDSQRISFCAILEGNGHNITRLYVNLNAAKAPETPDYGGLIGFLGTSGEIRNLGLLDNTVRGRNYLGGLVGYNCGTIVSSYSTGHVSGIGFNTDYIDQLVLTYDSHYEVGTIASIYFTGDKSEIINDSEHASGLVAYQGGAVILSYATGELLANFNIGGLVGKNNGGIIATSYATGYVSGEFNIGGLVGYNNRGMILSSYATSHVSGEFNIGGLVGWNHNRGTIIASYATGNASKTGSSVLALDNRGRASIDPTGQFETVPVRSYRSTKIQGLIARLFIRRELAPVYCIGGLVGQNNEGGIVTSSYATGHVSANYDWSYGIGGLVGYNARTSTINSSYATGNMSGLAYDIDCVGGLIDWRYFGTVISIYSRRHILGRRNIGGLVGINGGDIISSYWDRVTTAQNKGINLFSGADDAISLTTTQMQRGKNAYSYYYPNFDPYDNAWKLTDGRYPRLKIWASAGGDTKIGTIDDVYSDTLLDGQ